ncbi:MULTISPECIES: CRISPR-associated protein Cas4 [unclassified Methanoregula]|uniref:CRISPR-associated protein Cas4 n=1 Tax=unclassified Methanoregula TaxID=2649730 RepID=UPI0009CE57B4|nr:MULTISPECIES: CRISPR-associated protein Cas4 [unclassified Methanoregula]OPX62901.1 MAG: PD-(D/E)XK nuclease superfamily protein [Methanoregula sp. PtaB.Bin085]OPY35338.1 MAG: PD-(D/E)XK nuclease superfamily protein [Methanoregula sp. PtaU1.Bin006]
MNGKLYSDDELLLLSGIQHFCFCQRQWALIHVEQQWSENLRTAEGHIVHERVDDPFLSESRGDVVISRSFPLVSYSLGLTGIADVIEFTRSDKGIAIPDRDGLWCMKPVEYKRGKPKIDERDEVQLCAQVMCLEEMFGIRIIEADFYYNEIRRRERIAITDDLRHRVQLLANEMHKVFRNGITPQAEKGKHCILCSLIDICVPRLTKKKSSVRNYIGNHIRDACAPDT